MCADAIAAMNSGVAPGTGFVAAKSASVAMPLIQAGDFSNGLMRGLTLNDIDANGDDHYAESDFTDLAATKANLVRVFLPLRRACGSCSKYDIPAAEVATAKHILQDGESYGFKVVITFAIPPSNVVEKEYGTRDYWSDTYLQNSIKTNWAQLAAQLKSYPALAAYDLINEPVPPGGHPAQRSAWNSFAITLVNAIRSVDPSHVIVFEPAPFALPDSFNNLQPLPFKNIVYSFHFYQTHAFTHQGVYADTPYGVNYPNAVLNKNTLSQSLQPVRDFVSKYGASIYVGEFSVARWAPNNSSYNYIKDSIELFEAEKWSWTYLGWRGYHGWDAEIPSTVPRNLTAVAAAKLRAAHTPSIDLIRSYFTYN